MRANRHYVGLFLFADKVLFLVLTYINIFQRRGGHKSPVYVVISIEVFIILAAVYARSFAVEFVFKRSRTDRFRWIPGCLGFL